MRLSHRFKFSMSFDSVVPHQRATRLQPYVARQITRHDFEDCLYDDEVTSSTSLEESPNASGISTADEDEQSSEASSENLDSSLESWLVNDTYYFAETLANNNSLVLTLNGCYAWCSNETKSINSQCGLRLFQWVLPAVILVGSTQTPLVVWWKRLWAMLRPIGDPLDRLLSMIYVLKVYAKCYNEAKQAKVPLSNVPGESTDQPSRWRDQLRHRFSPRQRVDKSLAVVLHGIRDLKPSLNTWNLGDCLKSAVPASPRHTMETLLNNTAAEIMDNRSRELWKAYGATFFTVASIVFAMIPPAAPGSTPVSGATTAETLALSPLLLMVMLSNAIGEHKSLHALHKIIRHFLEELNPRMVDTTSTSTDTTHNANVASLVNAQSPGGSSPADANGSSATHREQEDNQAYDLESGSQHWDPANLLNSLRDNINGIKKGDLEELLFASGSLYYQPQEDYSPQELSDAKSSSTRSWDRVLLLASLSVVPISLAGASGALAAPPSYFNDRNFLMVGIAFVWLASPFVARLLAMMLNKANKQGQKLLWRFVVIKDSLVAISILVLPAGITCRMQGDCKMWSGYYYYGPAAARIPLITTDIFNWNDYVLYLALVSVCIGWNVAAYFGVRYFGYCRYLLGEKYYSGAARDAFHVLVWRHREIRDSLYKEEGHENVD